MKDMIDAAVALKRFSFLGQEFLAWLLWKCGEGDPVRVHASIDNVTLVTPGSEIVLQKVTGGELETIIMRGSLEEKTAEIRSALRDGYHLESVNLSFCDAADQRYSLTVDAKNLCFSKIKTPLTEPVRTADDLEGALIEKLSMHDWPITNMDVLYGWFLTKRLDAQTWKRELAGLNEWLAAGVNGAA